MSNDEKPNLMSRFYECRFKFWKKFPWVKFLNYVSIVGVEVILTIIIIYFILLFSKKPDSLLIKLFVDSDTGSLNKYLLSATAQVLGAIFALVFSIALVAGQTVARYTHRAVNLIFDRSIFIYAGTFAFVTIGVLWCIQYPTNLLTRIALVIGALFILSIPAFIFHLVQRMNLHWIPKRLKEICVEALMYGADEKAREMIDALDNIGTVALKEGNFEAAAAAEKNLADSLLEIQKVSQKLKRALPEFHERVFEGLRDTCEELIDTPRAPKIIIENLGRVGVQAIDEWLKSSDIPKDATWEEIKDKIPKTALYAINLIMIVSEACEKEIQDRLLFTCVVALAEMAEAANDLGSLKEFIADKIKGVCPRFKNKKRWHPKVIKHMRSRRMWSLLVSLLRPIYRPKSHSG